MKKVIALSDFEALGCHELSIKKGDIIEMIEEETYPGWCLGRKDGKIGLYSAWRVTGIYMIFL